MSGRGAGDGSRAVVAAGGHRGAPLMVLRPLAGVVERGKASTGDVMSRAGCEHREVAAVVAGRRTWEQ